MNHLFEELQRQLIEEKEKDLLKSYINEKNDELMKAINDFLSTLKELDIDIAYTLSNHGGYIGFALETMPCNNFSISEISEKVL